MLPAVELAKAVASTEFVPRAMRNNPAAISAAILYGDEIGVGPMQSIARIKMIDGTPTLLAETQRGLVLAAGHDLWPDELTSTRATWCGRRAGSDQITRITWTMDTARTAGLAGRQNYRSYPRQMLSARASAELVRAIFADVVGGLAATEEIDDELELAGAAPERPAGRGTSRRRRQGPAGDPAPGRATPTAPLAPRPLDLPPLPGEDDATEPAPVRADDAPAMVSKQQRNRIMARYREQNVERGDRLRDMSQIIGRQITSGNELTADEADRVLDDLEARRSDPETPETPEIEP
jgi:hypothetical protein